MFRFVAILFYIPFRCVMKLLRDSGVLFICKH